MKTKILNIVGIVLLLLGFCFCAASYFGISALSTHSVYYLHRFYGPERFPQTTYDDLYRYAEHLTRHRNDLGISLYLTIGGFISLLGLVAMTWSRDRKKLERPKAEPALPANPESIRGS